MFTALVMAPEKLDLSFFNFEELQPYATKLAIVLIFAWIAYIIAQYIMPSKRQAKIKWGRVAVMGFGAILLLKLEVITWFINTFILVAWSIGHVLLPGQFT